MESPAVGEVAQAPARNALGGALARGDGQHAHAHAHTHRKIRPFTKRVTSRFKLLICRASKGSSAHGRDETKGKPGTGLAQTHTGRAPRKAVPCSEGPRCSSVLVPVPSPAADQGSDLHAPSPAPQVALYRKPGRAWRLVSTRRWGGERRWELEEPWETWTNCPQGLTETGQALSSLMQTAGCLQLLQCQLLEK